MIKAEHKSTLSSCDLVCYPVQFCWMEVNLSLNMLISLFNQLLANFLEMSRVIGGVAPAPREGRSKPNSRLSSGQF
jgi:hypothetical protein